MNICMISDFFFPSLGGVENHIYQLSCYLQRLGNKVIVITHKYKDRQGIRYMGNGVKVYYLGIKPTSANIIFPTVGFSLMSSLRKILITERIHIIHCHQGTSMIALDSIMLSGLMEIPVVMTDHSLFAFNDLACVNINKVLTCLYHDVQENIAVSYIGKENIIHRAGLREDRVHVIPNCIDFSRFKPLSAGSSSLDNKQDVDDGDTVVSKNKPVDINTLPYVLFKEDYINDAEITLVSISRQTYRKGTDLLIEVIPILYKMFPKMKFIIGGDGDKKYLLDKMVSCFNMFDRVELTGGLPHHKVTEYMQKGDIYLNTSLTEAFCIAILEAASTGMFVISTDIGGVSEVLPENMRILVQSDKMDITKAVVHAVENLMYIKQQNKDFHKDLRHRYNWYFSSKKTEEVYQKAIKKYSQKTELDRYKEILCQARFSGLFQLLIIIVQLFFYLILCFFQPKSALLSQKTKSFDNNKYKEYLKKLKKTKSYF